MQPHGELLPAVEAVRWVEGTEEPKTDTGETLATISHDVIRRWAAERGAEPATGVGTVDVEDGGAEIRFNFPGYNRLRPISWDEWFEIFDRHRLAFVYEEQVGDGQQSARFRLVPYERVPR